MHATRCAIAYLMPASAVQFTWIMNCRCEHTANEADAVNDPKFTPLCRVHGKK